MPSEYDKAVRELKAKQDEFVAAQAEHASAVSAETHGVAEQSPVVKSGSVATFNATDLAATARVTSANVKPLLDVHKRSAGGFRPAPAVDPKSKGQRPNAPTQAAAVSAMGVTSLAGGVAAPIAGASKAAAAAVGEKHRAVSAAAAALQATLLRMLPADPRGDAAGLDPSIPIAFLPVRIETRFAESGRELLVRIYPDEIFADSHEPALSDDEWGAGMSYWSKQRAGLPDPGQWPSLVRTFGAPRAAWIVRQTEPTSPHDTWPPVFPPRGELRVSSWSRATEAMLLPNRWMAVTIDRTGARRAWGPSNPVSPVLALSVSPGMVRGTGTRLDRDGPEIANDLLWTVDFEAAERAGMAMRIPISTSVAADGIERLIVFGLRSLSDPIHAAADLRDLFDAHHFSRGFAFVPQGTRSNHTQNFPAGFPVEDPGARRSFDVERTARARGDGHRLARALGLDEHVVAHIEGADMQQGAVPTMVRASLWPATLGYFLDRMLAPSVDAESLDAARGFFVEWVQAQGPYPAFRLGRVPYGLLPVTSMEAWRPPRGAKGAEVVMPDIITRLRRVWLQGADAVPRVGHTDDPDGDLGMALAIDASTREVLVRTAVGPLLVANASLLFGVNPDPWFRVNADRIRLLESRLGLRAGTLAASPIAAVNFSESAPSFELPLVIPSGDPPDAALVLQSIDAIRNASIADLRAGELALSPAQRGTLLFRLLRHARLIELVRLAEPHTTEGRTTGEQELTGILTDAGTARSIWERIGEPAAGGPGVSAASRALAEESGARADVAPTFRAALAALTGSELWPAETPARVAAIERAFGETLDVCSHRIDAWITALATQRLERMRERAPTGVHLGAYGWAERIFPWTAGRSRAPGGFLHAPSIDQAASAAVLRNAHISHVREERDRYAINLSSRRVRSVQSLLEAVRQGQPLAAVLGAVAERRLHERGLDRHLEALRAAFPYEVTLVRASMTPGDTVLPRHVVDGLRMRLEELPPALRAHADAEQLTAIRHELVEVADAISDVLLAEGIYQGVRGNVSAAGASLDAIAREGRPPEPEVIESARTGTTLVHRVLITFSDEPPVSDWEAIPRTLRAQVEPRLDAWVGTLLGPPGAIRVRAGVVRMDASGTRTVDWIEMTPATLGLRPLDVLAFAGTAPSADVPPDLDAMIAARASALSPGGATIEIVHERDPLGAARTIPQTLALARSINQLLARARPARLEDFGPPEAHGTTPSLPEYPDVGSILEEGATRLSNALSAVEAWLVHNTDPSIGFVRDRLAVAAYFGIFGAGAGSHGSDPTVVRSSLMAASTGVAGEIRRRLDAYHAATDAAARARALFGPTFVLLPRIAVDVANIGGTPAGASEPAVRQFVQQAATVRPGVRAWRRVALGIESAGRRADPFVVGQIPVVASPEPNVWWALPFTRTERTPRSAVSHLLAIASGDAATIRAGLLIDSWTDTIPGDTQTTGVSLHYESPASEAGHCILLAVPPVEGERWTLDTIAAVLNESFDLARIRAVDAEPLGDIGQLIPTMFLTANTSGDAVTTNFQGALHATAPRR